MKHEESYELILREINALVVKLTALTVKVDNILAQTTKTNGRVTTLEERASGWDITDALNNQRKALFSWWSNALGVAIIGLLCGGAGFGILLVLQKTEILQISTVSAETYDLVSD